MNQHNIGNVNKAPAPPVPATVQDLDDALLINHVENINDLVHAVFRAMWVDPDFQDEMTAIWDSEAKHGSCWANHIMAALQIKDYAEKHEIAGIVKANITTISKSLGTVRRRFGLSVKQRRLQVAGETVQSNGGEAVDTGM